MVDIILCHPRDVLFPWWMQAMRRHRASFGKIIVVMTQQATQQDFTGYIRANIPDVTLIETYEDDGTDWRNAALTEGLKASTADRVLFLEQDFLFTPSFLERTLALDSPIIGFYGGTRLHPAFLLVTKELLAQTGRDFSVEKDIGDHFSKLSKELDTLGGIHVLEPGGWIHLSGLTQNYRLESHWHQPQLFAEYNILSQTLPQHPDWKEICRVKQAQMGLFSPNPMSLQEYFYEM